MKQRIALITALRGAHFGYRWRSGFRFSFRNCMQQVTGRLLRTVLVPVTVVALAAGAVLVSGPAPARAAGVPEFTLIVNSGHMRLGITPQGHNNPIRLRRIASGVGIWDFTNARRWRNPFTGKIVRVVEIQNGQGNNECINLVDNMVFYLDSCVKGDQNELFWAIPTGSTTNGNPNYWYINVSASVQDLTYEFLTPRRLGGGSGLLAQPSGAGGRAAWERACFLNC